MRFIILICTTLLLVGCGSQKSATLTEKEQRQWEQLGTWVESRSFEIEATWANPLGSTALNAVTAVLMRNTGNTGNRINLLGNPNFLRVKGDTVSAFLPYFGERQMGGGYGRNTAIEFKGVPRNYEVEKDTDKKNYTIKFDISEQTENFQVMLILFANHNATMAINSTQRSTIRYDGKVSAIKEEE